MALFKLSSEFCDTVSIVAHCVNDSSYMFVQTSPSAEYWIPTSKVPLGSSVIKQLAIDTAELFGTPIICDYLLRIYKFWLPNMNFSITHFVYGVKVDQEQKKHSKQTTGKYKGKINWITDHDLFRIFSMNNMRSPELFEMIMSWKNKTPNSIPEIFKSDGIHQAANLMEMSELVIINQPINVYEDLVLASPLTKPVQTNLYKEFILLCYPSFFMGMQNFCKFFSNLGWSRPDQMDLFRTADIFGRYGISFREFLYIIAAVEPTNNIASGTAGELRIKLLFKFYDKDNDGVLNADEFRLLLQAKRRSLKQSTDPSAVQIEFSESYKAMRIAESTPISQEVFLKAVLEDKIKNTSSVFRSPTAVITYLKDLTGRESRLIQPETKKIRAKSMTPDVSVHSRGASSVAIKYELGAHAIKIYTAGTLNIDKLVTLDAVTQSSTQIPVLDEVRRMVSVDQFNQESISNELLKSLRYMNLVNKQNKKRANQFTWGNVDSGLFANRLITICRMTNEIVKNEPRLLHISSPVYVLGDLHGNFTDLLQFESVLWHVGPVLCPSNILFLGDYVDRGTSSIEVIAYLFSYKIQNPSKIKLVRGNHEIREVQRMFTFFNECNVKFGDKLGSDVWSAINATFDSLPIAAIVDNSVFCCHGGIPPPWLCPVISCINEIPVPLGRPDEQSALAWEIMWNDPIRAGQMNEFLQIELSANEGFAVNKRRGTAHMFSSEALEKFLKSNGLSHLIRAHEVSPSGFSVMHRGKLLTVFSSSKYCGGQNDAACVMIDQGRIRIMRIESDD
ncbi:hypothetical protein WA026_001735 [Henosepilachna vigintioctopunctata]|uniref:Serine/threonine-protein phosphatase n=1 Tax=Henosepilachna vigintioctopunctata TaxID=420089 RepID=A0AAW1UJ32_9CUCU